MSQSDNDDEVGIDLTQVVTPTELAKVNPNAKYNVRQVRYSPGMRAFVTSLHMNGLTYRDISNQTGVSIGTISEWVNNVDDEAMECYGGVAEQAKSIMASKMYGTVNRCISHMDNDKLEKSSAKDLAIIAGIMTEKGRLLDGESTENHAHIVKSSSRSSNQLNKERNTLNNIDQRIRDLGGDCDE